METTNSKKKEAKSSKASSSQSFSALDVDDVNPNLQQLALADLDAYDVVEYDTPKLIELEINSGPGLKFEGDCDNVSVTYSNSPSHDSNGSAINQNQLCNSTPSHNRSAIGQHGLLVVGDIHGSLRSLFSILHMVKEHLQLTDTMPCYCDVSRTSSVTPNVENKDSTKYGFPLFFNAFNYFCQFS
jgi:hypothetical protein